MGTARVNLLVADVDGTLVTQSKVLTPRACDAVRRLSDAGILFAITSGRPPRGLSMLVEPLALTSPVAAFNGGMFVEPDLTTLIEQRTLPLAVGREVLGYLLEAGLDVWVYRGVDWFIRDAAAPHVARERATVRFAPTVVHDLTDVLDGAVTIVGVGDDLPIVARCEGELRHRVGAHASAARSQPYYLDVTHPDANKGNVVRTLARLLGVPLEQVATIGDMPNDVLMFGVAGTSIAMGNASPEVQRTARFVTTSNEEDGFARAVEMFVLDAGRAAASTLGLPTSIRACLFDLDGVLTQTATIHANAWKQVFDDYLSQRSASDARPFVPFDVAHDYAVYVDGKPRLDGARSFLRSRGIELPDAEIGALAARKDELVTELLQRRGVATYAGSIRYVRAVREAGLRTAVVSSSRHCQQVLEKAGIANLFDARIDGVVAAEAHLMGKPAPDTYLAAGRALGVAAIEAAIFEDALAGSCSSCSSRTDRRSPRIPVAAARTSSRSRTWGRAGGCSRRPHSDSITSSTWPSRSRRASAPSCRRCPRCIATWSHSASRCWSCSPRSTCAERARAAPRGVCRPGCSSRA
jgi:Cof subfamily protein (haloacid dehalogenase superfamily)/beta-phosphoglucomutase family hydrolase